MYDIIILCVAMLYLFAMSFAMSTQNFLSALLFKFSPFLIGAGLGFITLVRLGWLVL